MIPLFILPVLAAAVAIHGSGKVRARDRRRASGDVSEAAACAAVTGGFLFVISRWLVLALAFPAFWPPIALAQTGSERVLIFSAASLKTALDEAMALPAIQAKARVVVSYAGTPALVRQIEQGAPADILISADVEWMDHAVARKLVRPQTRVDLFGNRLVLVARKVQGMRPAEIKPGIELARLIGNGRLALGQVESVPAGKYARAALMSLDLWDQVRGRLAEAENVRVALRFVALGEAPAGIVYETDAKAERDVEVIGTFPASSHPRIVYPAALTTSAGTTAERIFAVLRSREARHVFERHGFKALD